MNSSKPQRWIGRACGAAALVSSVAIVPACLTRPVETIEPRVSTTIREAVPNSKVDKIDILISIDDSGSMADKQKILAEALPELVTALANPKCFDDDGNVFPSPCPEGSQPEFDPINDIHIGIVSTSLGARGSSVCTFAQQPLGDRNGELLELGGVPTFEGRGFLVWNPDSDDNAPGLYKDVEVLRTDLEKMVIGVGQEGCGYEAQLESLYRFLVDPEPYDEIQLGTVSGQRETRSKGIDQEVLKQRADFLRADSLVAVVMLSDENDCSFDVNGTGFYTAAAPELLASKGTAVCMSNPTDPCCMPCGDKSELCDSDPSCAMPAPIENGLSGLTCWEQKRRYGADHLYPLQRYIDGFSKREIRNTDHELVDNPLFVSADGFLRDPSRVFVLGIAGVPWQLIARQDVDGQPKLTLGVQTAKEMSESGTWAKIAGDPTNYVPPTDPHMVESWRPREALADPDSPRGADPFIGHEFYIQRSINDSEQYQDRLQHGCIFELPEPIDCTLPGTNCDCDETDWKNPLCQAPDGSYSSETQYFAKAYPSLRQLSMLEGLGDQGVVSSICPAQLSDNGIEATDFGYRPAIAALVDRLKVELSDPCLPTKLQPDVDGQVSCLAIEGRFTGAETCECDAASARRDFDAAALLQDSNFAEVAQYQQLDCFCRIEQLHGEEQKLCREQIAEPIVTSEGQADGWCYIDATSAPVLGNPQLAAHCPDTQERVLRFVGAGEIQDNATLFLHCTDG